jgi:hypothetical protein
MKSKVKDKYFTLDLINVILGICLVIASIIVLIDVRNNQEFVPYIILLGSIINILSGMKGLKQKNKRKLLLPVGGVLFIMSLMIFLGFGGF